ncbi:sulfotransferase domain-containing protein [Salinibacter altiplanensis]|uniref:sulfotransferase domain-containing protein n=1 Tax=Salinibacter altiplanensis TaxID=1803181 RepID=UPI000C9F0B9A
MGEVSAKYISSDCAPRRAYSHLPNIKLFASLRNPIDQTHSYYWHLQRQNFQGWRLELVDRIESFEDAIEDMPEKLLSPGFHYRNLQRWLQYYDRSQLHVILFNDIKQEPEKVLSRLYKHLGVDPTFRPDSMKRTGHSARRGTSPRGPIVERVRQFLYMSLNRHLYHPLKRVIGPHTADRIKEALHLRQIMERFFRKEGYPEMKLETWEQLYEIFREDIQKLESFLDQDLSHWTS